MKHRGLAKRILRENNANPQEAQLVLRAVVKDRKHILPGLNSKILAKLRGVRTIVDIGVLEGTPALYNAFPEAYLILVEPHPQYASVCRQILSKRTGLFFPFAASNYNGSARIFLNSDCPGLSKLVESMELQGEKGELALVEARRLDDFVKETCLGDATLMKIDVEGHEYEVLEGANSLLAHVSYIIVEMFLGSFSLRPGTFARVISLLDQNGFDAVDFLRVTRRKPFGLGAHAVDMLFARRGSLT